MKRFWLLLLFCFATWQASAQGIGTAVPVFDGNGLELVRRVFVPLAGLFLLCNFVLAAIKLVLNYLLKRQMMTAATSESIVERLLPLADLATPNAHEAAVLAGVDVTSADDALRAARAIHALGPRAVRGQGGPRDAPADAVDVLVSADGEALFRSPRLDTPHTHGTGCTLASAIAANLARGPGLGESVRRARAYVHAAIRHAPGLGGGHGPTRHFWFLTGDEAAG